MPGGQIFSLLVSSKSLLCDKSNYVNCLSFDRSAHRLFIFIRFYRIYSKWALNFFLFAQSMHIKFNIYTELSYKSAHNNKNIDQQLIFALTAVRWKILLQIVVERWFKRTWSFFYEGAMKRSFCLRATAYLVNTKSGNN